MYKHDQRQTILPHEFFLPFGGKLNPNNRWCRLAQIIPWTEVEEKYAKNFNRRGQAAYSVRVALGALIIQNRKSLSDQELVVEISENPYMQYFLGFPGFVEDKPFDPSLMVHFRKRLGKDIINEINEMIARPAVNHDDSNDDSGNSTSKEIQPEPEIKKSGKLLLDATCTPADIHNSFYLLIGDLVVTLADKDYIIVGYEEMPVPFINNVIQFLSSNSLDYKEMNSVGIYKGVKYILKEKEHVINCLKLKRLSDIMILRIMKRQPISKIEVPKYDKAPIIKNDLEWYENRIENYYAICCLTNTQTLALQIYSKQIRNEEMLTTTASVSKKYFIEKENNRLHVIYY